MTRRIAAAVLLMLCLCVAAPVARGPAPPAPGWDLFAAEAHFASLPAPVAAAAFGPELAALPAETTAHAAPEPVGLLVLAFALGALTRRSAPG